MQRNGRLKLFVLQDLLKSGNQPIVDLVRDKIGAYWQKIENNIAYNQIKNYTTVTSSLPNGDESINLTLNEPITASQPFADFLKLSFEDYSFNQILPYNANYPYTITQQPNTSKIVFSNKSIIKSTEYETFKSNNDEIKYLNYYVGLGRDIKNNEDIESLVSLTGSIDDSALGVRSSDGVYPEATRYFHYYSNLADNFFKDNSGYLQKLKNIVLDGKTAKLYASPFSLKEAFNSYIQIDLHKEKAGEVSKNLSDTDLNLKLISDLFIERLNKQIKFSTSEQFLKFRAISNPTPQTEINKNNLVELDSQYNSIDIKTYDLISWSESNIAASNSITDPQASNFFNFDNENALIIGSKVNLDKETTRDNPFLVKLYSRLFYSKLLKLAREKYFRTFDEILKGKLCHTEIIGFRIDKYSIPSGFPLVTGASIPANGPKFINSTYFENNDTEIINFIDTQIKKWGYFYKIYYYVAVFGNKYSYSLDNHSQDTGTRTFAAQQPIPSYNSFKVTNSPSVQIFEIDASKTPEIDNRDWIIPEPIDNSSYPPNTPIVEPIPYFDYRYRTQLKFNFQKVIDNMSIGVPYYGILEEDADKISIVVNSQKNKYPEDTILNPPKVRFKTQPNKHVYQVFRTTNEPLKYTDFNEVYKTIGSIQNNTEPEVDSFIDNLEPNTDYYYTFRAMDTVTELFSNPTVVYVIRMIKDSDIYYPVVRVLDLAGLEKNAIKNSLDSQKKFKKYLQIKPNLSKLTSNNNVLTHNINGKDITVRITSIKTGRKIDIKFNYNLIKKNSSA